MNTGTKILIAAAAALLVFGSAVFTVYQTQYALVLQFGKVVRTIQEPGLKLKIPFINEVRKFDRRILGFELKQERFLTNEKKNLDVDAFVKWRIHDVTLFYTRLGGDVRRANERLLQIIGDGLRSEFGKRSIQEVVAEDRSEMMAILTEQTNVDVSGRFGVEIVDVRIRRIELPEDVSTSVYQRMEAERKRVAQKLRAEGSEAASRIRADADRQREVLLAEAYRDAEQVRGEGDATAAEVYAKAYSRNPEFFSFYRSLDAYKRAFAGAENMFVLDPDSEFFKYFRGSRLGAEQ
jgi:membrane protease subunit HflC